MSEGLRLQQVSTLRQAVPLPDYLFERHMPDVDHRTAGEVLSHPAFATVRRSYVVGTLANYEITRFPGNIQAAAYRTAAIGVLVCLWSASDPADRATWPTVAHFKQLVSAFSLAGTRQIDDFIGRLVRTGDIVLDRVATDGRVRLLRPTDKLLAWDRQTLKSYYDVLQALYPEPGYGPAVACDLTFQRAHRKGALAVFPAIGKFLHRNVDLLPFHQMYQGGHILMVLTDLALADPGKPIRERDLIHLRDRFGVSRSHIRNILQAAETAGLLVRTEQARQGFVPTPRGLTAVDIFIANTLAAHDLTYRLAFHEMGRDVCAPLR
ncbi:hypothetical protein DK427_23730 [Methylobacterium radiodurans]|uniref:Uncharacterized protein n=2 Tax=Methylobacterium radiodurans TaxID=2202828 RepID=A0A2U8VYP2_9HYPH|nr:hypothetical protein DK427_23730 [Methylobacterium radiodurans]